MTEKINIKLTELNRIKSIYSILGIPAKAQVKDFDFSSCYEFKYCKKNHGDGHKETKKERINRYLSVNKSGSKVFDEIPANGLKKDYRPIINYKKDSGWLKKSQRIVHKFLVSAFNDVEYLHSTIKEKSYASNGHAHCDGNKYIFAIDLSDFFTQINFDRVYKTIKYGLNLNKNTATFYASLLTCPLEKGSKNLVLGQGLPSSPILAYWTNKSLFDYIYNISNKNGINLTVYVDDITFSSKDYISQEFINNILGLFRKNGLKIKRKKTHYYKSTSIKKVTGVYIKEGKPKVSHNKHEEIFTIYKEMIKIIHNEINTIEEFLYFYGLFLKFSGNFIHLCQVEYDGDFSTMNKKFPHQKYAQLYNELVHRLNIGLNRNDKNLGFEFSNLIDDSPKKACVMFKNYKMREMNLKSKFPMVR